MVEGGGVGLVFYSWQAPHLREAFPDGHLSEPTKSHVYLQDPLPVLGHG
jgi:hypothetical protein